MAQRDIGRQIGVAWRPRYRDFGSAPADNGVTAEAFLRFDDAYFERVRRAAANVLRMSNTRVDTVGSIEELDQKLGAPVDYWPGSWGILVAATIRPEIAGMDTEDVGEVMQRSYDDFFGTPEAGLRTEQLAAEYGVPGRIVEMYRHFYRVPQGAAEGLYLPEAFLKPSAA